MLKKMFKTVAVAGALSLAAVPFVTSVANAQGTGTEPPKAPDPSTAMKSSSMSKGGGMMKKSSKHHGGMMMKKKSHKKM